MHHWIAVTSFLLVAFALVGCNWDFLEGNCPDGCDDGNPCTADSCVAIRGCVHDPAREGHACTYEEISGTCRDGVCGGEHLCEDVVCADEDLCTDDSCTWNGRCVFTAIECSDNNECTEDTCDPDSGMCEFRAQPEDGSWCFSTSENLALAGSCDDGVCVGPCDPSSQEESVCPLDLFDTLVCCPGTEYCAPEC